MAVSDMDRSVLRRLAERQAEIASLSSHQEKAAEWKRLNANKPGRPLVWVRGIPWHEMDVNGELELQTVDPFCRTVEQGLRRMIYQWDHFPGDMVVEAGFHSPLVIGDTDFGISEDAEVVTTDEKSNVVSRDFRSQIDCEADLAKIKMPVITHDREASERNYQCLTGIFGDILAIEKVGIMHAWFAPWDELIRWWDVEKALLDLAMRPELVHQAMERLLDAHMSRLQQWREQNLLSVASGCRQVGSGGLGYTDELPQEDFDAAYVRTIDQWGFSTAQIFSEVSPAMHEEFALRYERRWLENFGLNYYGCCEPLHKKIDILKSIPRLRKISMSPWANVEEMVEAANGEYVLSYKPNPAILAHDRWNPAMARKDLVDVLARTKGCAVEIVMKDISTVRYEPQRLWEWAEMAIDAVRETRLV